MSFIIEDVQEMPASNRSRSGVYAELYKIAEDLPIDGKKRVGPMTRRQANSLQTSLTGSVSGKDWKIVTNIRNKDGHLPEKGPDAECWLYFQKVAVAPAN